MKQIKKWKQIYNSIPNVEGTMVEINDDETLEDLKKYNLKIFQKKDGFRFSVDAVLISNFFKPIKKGIVVDFGTGTGIIPLLIQHNDKISKIYGLEIQETIFKMAKKSIEINDLSERIEIIHGDINAIEDFWGKDSVDHVISNPPYFSRGKGTVNDSDLKKISRHECDVDIDILVYKAKRILKTCGTFTIIYKTDRLQELVTILSKHLFEIHRIRFVHTKEGKKASLVMIEAVKERNRGMVVEPPLIITKTSGEYSEEYKNYYL